MSVLAVGALALSACGQAPEEEGGAGGSANADYKACMVSDEGGWDGATIEVPTGDWRDLLTGHEFSVAGEAGVASEEATDGPVELETLLGTLPVALLVRT